MRYNRTVDGRRICVYDKERAEARSGATESVLRGKYGRKVRRVTWVQVRKNVLFATESWRR